MQAGRMRLTVVGSGDAFGSGGRYQTCFLIETAEGTVMLDCGATTTTALNALQRDPNDVATIVISHLHGDHFSGLIFLVVQALFATRRATPLTVFGPPGIAARVDAAMDVLFPGLRMHGLPFDLRFIEMRAGHPIKTGPLDAVAYEVDHPSGAPSHGLRLSYGGRTLAFTGDTRWTDSVVEIGRGADLYIMECYAYQSTPAAHLTWTQIQTNLDRIGASRVLLTHMNDDMLARSDEVIDPRVVVSLDGMVLDV